MTRSSCSSPGRPSSTSLRSSNHGARLGARRQPPLLARVRPERDHGAEQEDEAGEPDQIDERLHEYLQVDGADGLLLELELVADHEQILRAQPVMLDRDL